MTYQQWLQQAVALLYGHTPTPRCDAEVLLTYLSGHSRAYGLAFGETLLSQEQQKTLAALLYRRRQGQPIAYLVGQREFWSLPLKVSAATLIPRPESECLVEQTLLRLPTQPCQLLELGTGSGAIALAVASERPDCQISASDRCPEALQVAQENATALNIDNVTFFAGDWFEPFMGRYFSAVISNPPYIAIEDPHLQQGDLRFEPHGALVAAKQGLAALHHIIQQAWHSLLPGGWLLLEHGWQQGEAVSARLRRAGYCGVMTIADYAGHPRVTLGQRQAE